MNAQPHLKSICRRVVESYRRVYGDDVEAIYLYGSYARGDFDEESDIDFVAIVNGERLPLQAKRFEVWKDINKMDLEYDTVSSAKVIPSVDFYKYKDFLAYYKNIEREGVRIG